MSALHLREISVLIDRYYILRLAIPERIGRSLPTWLASKRSVEIRKQVNLDDRGQRVEIAPKVAAPKKSKAKVNAKQQDIRKGGRLAFDSSDLLNRITVSRRLLTGMTRLLQPKAEVVRGLRKRGGEWGEMSIYLGDLQGMFRLLLVEVY